MNFTEEELKLLGHVVQGTYYDSDPCTDGNLIFSSHTFPAHRITVDGKKARAYLDSCYAAVVLDAQGD